MNVRRKPLPVTSPSDKRFRLHDNKGKTLYWPTFLLDHNHILVSVLLQSHAVKIKHSKIALRLQIPMLDIMDEGILGETCRLNVHQFKERILETPVHFLVIQMKESYLVWIGGTPNCFANLAMAMSTRYVSHGTLFPATALQSCTVFYSIMIIYSILEKCWGHGRGHNVKSKLKNRTDGLNISI